MTESASYLSHMDVLDLYDVKEFDLTEKQKACRFNSPVSQEKINALVDKRIPIQKELLVGL